MKKVSLQSIRDLLDSTNHKIRYTKANKLWWNKYTYRLEFRVDQPRSWTGKFEDELHGYSYGYRSHKKTNAMNEFDPNNDPKQTRQDRWVDFQIRFNKFKKTHDVKTREEWGYYQVYAADLKDFKYFIQKVFKDNGGIVLTELKYFPEDVDINALKNVVLCNHLPYHEYKYKVLFKSGKQDDWDRFVKWIDKYDKEGENPFHMTPATREDPLKWGWSNNGYMYVRDDKHLHLLTFRASDAIKRVEEYKVRP